MKTNFREWQKNAIVKIHRCIKSNKTEYVPVPACVGSGKTLIMTTSFGDFITENINEKTIQVFVSPRIKLCKQQCDEIREKLEDIFGYKENTDYKIIPIDCSQKDKFDKNNLNLENNTNHTIFVICDASLWGKDPDSAKAGKDPMIRYHRWIHQFETWQSQGFKFGCICYDEAHNYANEVDKMLPGGFY